MQSVAYWTRCLIFVLVFTIGCNSKTSTSTVSTEEGDANASTESASKSKKSVIPVKRDVKTIEGNWVVVVTNQRKDNYRWMIKLSRGADGQFQGEMLDTSRDQDQNDKTQLVKTDVQGDSIKLYFKTLHGTFDFEGSFQQGFIRGNIRSNPTEVLLTRLLPTDEKTLERFAPIGSPPATNIFEELGKGKDTKPEDIFKAARENRTSPIAQDAFVSLIQGHIPAGFDEVKLKEVIQNYLSAAAIWGERWVARAEMVTAVGLINGRQFTKMGVEHLSAAEQKLGDDRAALSDALTSFREAANVILRTQDITSSTSTDETKAAAFTELTQLLTKQKYNPEILSALAAHAERTGQIDLAINYLSDVVSIPMLEPTMLRLRAGQPPDTPTPSESLKKLWAQKNGSEDGFLQFVDDYYRTKIGEYLAEINEMMPALPATSKGTKRVLVELFTGMQSPQSVCADLTMSALGKTYAPDDVIIIRHHQHIPGPDGMVNQDSEERGAYYDTGSTPIIVVNGMPVDPRYYSGPIQMAAQAYAILRKNIIDPQFMEKTDISIELTAAVTEGQLNISAAATGIPEDILPSCRLRLAIVENEVHTIIPMGSNGIRDHEFLVRDMLGVAKGIPPKKGELKYSASIPLADLQQHLVDYIQRYEAGRRIEFPAEMKPPIKGALSLVAWVQNDKTDQQSKFKLVLQSALIPIEGDLKIGTANSQTPPTDAVPEKTAGKKDAATSEG
ncbi:MAG: hypothetical protein WCH39_25930, partial [Schlesneria sp.]